MTMSNTTSDIPTLDKLTFILNSDSTFYTVKALNASISGEIVIPSEYNGKPVKEIKKYAFAACKALTSITIPNSVTSIGYGAFISCSSLASINIPNSVISIGNYAFSACKALSSITIPNSVTLIGDEVFKHCTSLTTDSK